MGITQRKGVETQKRSIERPSTSQVRNKSQGKSNEIQFGSPQRPSSKGTFM